MGDAQEVVRRDAFLKEIQRGFALFDKDGRGHCDVREIGTIVRSLGRCPSELELRDMITEIEEEEPTGFIRFDKFEKMMLRVLMEDRYPRETEEKLLSAFHVIDTAGKGQLDAEKLRELLTTTGERFTSEEIDDMLAFAADKETGLVHYEDYTMLLEL